jgi:hypothetical protein
MLIEKSIFIAPLPQPPELDRPLMMLSETDATGSFETSVFQGSTAWKMPPASPPTLRFGLPPQTALPELVVVEVLVLVDAEPEVELVVPPPPELVEVVPVGEPLDVEPCPLLVDAEPAPAPVELGLLLLPQAAAARTTDAETRTRWEVRMRR